MGATAAVLKRHLSNRKVEWTQTWWEALERHRDSELLKSFWSDVWDRWSSWKTSSAPSGKSDWAKTWLEAFGRHRDSELLQTFCYNIHDGCDSSHREDLLFAQGQFMPLSVDHGPSLIRMSVSNSSHFRHHHHHQNRIHDGHHGGHLESLQLLSAPEQ